MASTSDTILRQNAHDLLSEAEAMMQAPAAVIGDVADTWDDIADRAERAWEWFKRGNQRTAARAWGKVRDAARKGLELGSDATDAVKERLRSIVARTWPVAAAMLILFLLPIIWLTSTESGHRSARAAGRMVASRYGF